MSTNDKNESEVRTKTTFGCLSIITSSFIIGVCIAIIVVSFKLGYDLVYYIIDSIAKSVSMLF